MPLPTIDIRGITMKNRILFIFLFIVIAIIGLNGTKITAAILSSNDEKELKKTRSSDISGAIYLSTDELSFDPMSIVDKNNSRLVSSSPEISRWYGNGSLDICCIMDSLIRNISIYSEKAEYVQPVENGITESIYAAPNGLYYIEKHPYYNKFHNRRYVDLIMDSEDLSIRYINFYDDQQHIVTSDAVQRGIGKFNEISVEFYSKVLYMFNSENGMFNWFSDYPITEIPAESESQISVEGNVLYPDYYFDPFAADEIIQPDFAELCDYYINCACEETKKLYIESGENNPMILFFALSSIPCIVSFKEMNGNAYETDEIYDENLLFTTRCITASMKFVSECVDSDFIKNEEFAAYNNRIYMTTKSQFNKKIIIYNVLTNEIEGFCDFYNDDVW